MIDLNSDPIGEFAQQWPRGTSFLLLMHRADDFPGICDYIPGVSSRGYVEWAVAALVAGHETPSLKVLAGLDYREPGSIWDAKRYFDRCIGELKLECPANAAILLRVHLSELVREIASGEADPQRTLDMIHWSAIDPLGHPEDLMPWCHLWEGNTPDGHQGRYSKDEYRDVIVAYAQSWIKNGPDVLLPQLGGREGLEVTCSPNPVKARQVGSNGRGYVWVFETKVCALDKAVEILEFGTFRWRRGRWVFASSTGAPYRADDFANHFSCPRAILRPGESYSMRNTVSRGELLGWKISWYFKGVAPLHAGTVVKGTSIVEGLPEVEE